MASNKLSQRCLLQNIWSGITFGPTGPNMAAIIKCLYNKSPPHMRTGQEMDHLCRVFSNIHYSFTWLPWSQLGKGGEMTGSHTLDRCSCTISYSYILHEMLLQIMLQILPIMLFSNLYATHLKIEPLILKA